MGDVKTVADLNPRSMAVKSLELTVLRAIQIIEAFDKLEKGEDWSDVPNVTWRKILGDGHYKERAVINEMWTRYKAKTLKQEVLDLHENLPPSAQKRKEIKDGVNAIHSDLDSRRKGRRPSANARGNRRIRNK